MLLHGLSLMFYFVFSGDHAPLREDALIDRPCPIVVDDPSSVNSGIEVLRAIK